jgi:hypothetical protein
MISVVSFAFFEPEAFAAASRSIAKSVKPFLAISLPSH